MKKILFRADANANIGTGDLMSFLYLSRHFSMLGWQPSFLIRDYDVAIRLVTTQGFPQVVSIDKEFDDQQEVEAINNFCAEMDIDVIFIQINEKPLSCYEKLNPLLFKGCVCFERDMPAIFDVTLSWDIDSEKYFAIERYPKTKFFIGPEFVILPPEYNNNFLKQRKRTFPRTRLLLAMGGADDCNQAKHIVNKLQDINCPLEIVVILGAGYSHLSELESILRESRLRYQLKSNVNNMIEEYLNADVAITAGGLTASESVAAGLPVFLVATYKHQIIRCKYFEDQGWAIYLGYRDCSSLSNDMLLTFSPGDGSAFRSRIGEMVQYISGRIA